jgi:trimeric autotransporter adhesin
MRRDAIITKQWIGALIVFALMTMPAAELRADWIAGNKPLYLYSTPTNNHLSRTPPGSHQSSRSIPRNRTEAWPLIPALAQAIQISASAGVIPVRLVIAAGSNNLNATVTLSSSQNGVIGTHSQPVRSSTPALLTFEVPITGIFPVTAGSVITLEVTNSSNPNHSITVYPFSAGHERSLIDLESLTVISVDQVTFYSDPYPAGGIVTRARPDHQVYVRAMVNDPFGSYDITSAELNLTSPGGVVAINDAVMTEVFDDGAAQKIFEYPFSFAPDADDGFWTVRVTAEEGQEGLVRNTGVGTIHLVRPPIISVLKSVVTESDPVNGTLHSKAIPGATLIYTLTVENRGGSGTDDDSVVIIDPIDGASALYVGDFMGVGPVQFADGAIPSGLTYTFGGPQNPGDDLAFSNNGGTSFDYMPVPDGDGFDGAVTHLRINPKGVFSGVSGMNVPSFTLQFRVRVQ